ncbi:GSCOCG00002442001-RA-CDS, partial [Cotesia congregata]
FTRGLIGIGLLTPDAEAFTLALPPGLFVELPVSNFGFFRGPIACNALAQDPRFSRDFSRPSTATHVPVLRVFYVLLFFQLNSLTFLESHEILMLRLLDSVLQALTREGTVVLLTVVAALTVLPCVAVGIVLISVLVVIGDFCTVGEASLTFVSATVDFTV